MKKDIENLAKLIAKNNNNSTHAHVAMWCNEIEKQISRGFSMMRIFAITNRWNKQNKTPLSPRELDEKLRGR